MRIGMIQYINSIPLYTGVEKYYDVVLDTPRNLTERFLSHELDISFIPTIAYIQHKTRCSLVPDLSISSFGPTRSVFLVYSGNIFDITTVRISDESMTSNFIVEQILIEQYGIRPIFTDNNIHTARDAKILIGDTALTYTFKEGEHALDIGKAWFEMTQQPIVYAVCVTRDAYKAHFITECLTSLRDKNMIQLQDILIQNDQMAYYEYIHNLNYELLPAHIQTVKDIETLWRKHTTLQSTS